MNTFYHGDCLFVMNHDIEPNSIDLIYLDPPFFTGKTQKGTAKWQPGAMEVSFEDSKKFWGDTEKVNAMRTKSPEWLRHIAQTRPDFASYLFYVMKRLEACHRVLNNKGSIYLHCDEKASHYLKMIMDGVFGEDKFHREIIWHYNRWTNAVHGFAKMHDSIFWYSKTPKYTFNKTSTVVTPTEYQKLAQLRGYSTNNINGKRQIIIFDESKAPKDLSPYEIITHKKPEDCVTYASNVWDDVDYLASQAKERVGYPTQKPIKLLERIILVSSNESNIVLDPFCGCGTAIIAAHKHNRRWIGIDINKSAHEVTKGREVQLPLGMANDFATANYVSRDIAEVKELNPKEFEVWVNEYFKAIKPSPDKRVDGIAPNNIPIQTKTNTVSYVVVSDLVTNAKYHPHVKQPFDHAIIVSQKGFDDGARQRRFEILTKEGIRVDLLTPEIMLDLSKMKEIN